MRLITGVITAFYNLLWGDLLVLPLPGGGSLGVSLLVLLLIPAGLFFTVRTRFLPVRMFPEMLRVTAEKRPGSDAISGVQALIVSTATRVGMGNLIGVVAAISAGGAGAVFWMWVTALIGSSTSGPAPQGEGPPVWRLAGRPSLLHTELCRAKAGQKGRPPVGAGGAVCGVRPGLLVRHQPGDQQLGLLRL